jgi:hypothetical protein
MKLKRKELLNLKQGQMTVTKYGDKFIQLSLYAPRSAESDKKKREHFIKGLNEDLQSILSLHEYSSLQDVINKAIGLESKLQKIISKKRKREFQGKPITILTYIICLKPKIFLKITTKMHIWNILMVS